MYVKQMRRKNEDETLTEEVVLDEDEDDLVDLEEIAARLDRILDRSRQIDFQLSAIERKRKWPKRTPEPQSPPPLTQKTQTNETSKAPQRKVAPKRPRKTFKQATKPKTNPKPSIKPRKKTPKSSQKKDITLSLIYNELQSLKQEIRGIAQNQLEMKMMLRE